MSYFQRETVKRGKKEGPRKRCCCKTDELPEQWEGGVGDVRWWSGSSSSGFVWHLSRSSTRWGLKALHSQKNHTLQSTVIHLHDVFVNKAVCVFVCFVFFLQPWIELCLTNYIDWYWLQCLEFSSSHRGPDNTSLSPIWSLSFHTISIGAMSSQQFHAIRKDCIVYTAAFKTITTCLGPNLSDSGHDRQFSWG